MQNKVNVGIIGKNFGYHVIYKSFLKKKEYRVKGFSFKSKKNNKVQIPKNIKIYSNWKKLILDRDIDAIIIAAPPFLHKKIIKFSIKNNKHIFCEKPFTCSYKEAEDICNLIKRKKNICHMVNYEFANIGTFNFFKKKIIKNIKIRNIYLNWFINLNKRKAKSWKENHIKGGDIIFNYICHSIYYLEFLFGNINSIKTNIFFNKKKKINSFKGTIFFKNNLSAKLNIQAGNLNKSIKPTHQLEISTQEKNYILKTNLNSLADKFRLIEIKKSSKKNEKILFKDKDTKDDFRIMPTSKNLKKFSNSILKGKELSPNFYDAKRIHLIINKMFISSKKNKKIRI
tara:strand:+ start:3103 stop:4125 length:1023 start_codon:yes stop_codon:yes gene_type:complete